jgi:SAM-dependent methyltransferase
MLDVGCGTGTVGDVARARVGPGALIAAVDVSLPMVHRAALAGAGLGVVATALHLPFHAGSFDVVTASLVLSHLPYEQALLEIVRVLKPGGKVGVTAWAQGGSRDSPASKAWVSLAKSLLGREALDQALRRVAPHEDRLGDGAQLTAALCGANLQDVQIQVREYQIAIPLSDYLEMYDVFTLGRFLRFALGSSRWPEFRRQAEEKLRAVCGERVEYTGRYHLAVGAKRES